MHKSILTKDPGLRGAACFSLSPLGGHCKALSPPLGGGAVGETRRESHSAAHPQGEGILASEAIHYKVATREKKAIHSRPSSLG